MSIYIYIYFNAYYYYYYYYCGGINLSHDDDDDDNDNNMNPRRVFSYFDKIKTNFCCLFVLYRLMITMMITIPEPSSPTKPRI